MNRSLASRALVFVLAALAVGSSAGGAGCSADPRGADPLGPSETEAASALRARFPEASRFVLDASRSLARRADGSFGLLEARADLPIAHRALSGSFAKRGASGVDFTLPDGFAIHVRELGLEDEGRIEGRALAYPRLGGTSFWAADERGYEEWLALDPGHATSARPAAVWEIEGGVLVETPGGVEIADASHRPRIRVEAPRGATESGRALTPRLEVHGHTIELWADSGGEAALVDPIWTSTMAMLTARYGHSATTLQDGRVLAAGGIGANNAQIDNAEIWDPATATWASTGKLITARAYHTATLFSNGKVLAAGGFGAGATTEIYTPFTNAWTAGPAMAESRYAASATPLGPTRVLIAGGRRLTSPFCASSAQVYDATTNAFIAQSTMPVCSHTHAAVRLADGRVLVVGGSDAVGTHAAAQIYDPVTSSWALTASMATPRAYPVARLLPSGKVLVAGGSSANGYDATAEIWDPVTGLWSSAGSMGLPRVAAAAFLATPQLLLVAGGFTLNDVRVSSTDLYDLGTGTWSPGPPMLTARALYPTATLQSGAVLLPGGSGAFATGQAISATEIFTGGTASNGSACQSALECSSGFCVDGYCCNTACNAGPCDACAVAAGAAANGVCTMLDGASCSDGNACTSGDTCKAGVCSGAPVTCAPSDGCHLAGACDPMTGVCNDPAKPDGAPCDDGNLCTQMDVCQNGACQPGAAVTCPPASACKQAGSCDPSTGTCDALNAPDGTACDDGDACTKADACVAGACVGASPVACPPPAACHLAGVCNAADGTCLYALAADGSTCDDGNPCTTGDSCAAGACKGTAVTCAAKDECHEDGSCDAVQGGCQFPEKADGTPCSGGVCQAGLCQKPDAGAGGKGSGGDGAGGEGQGGSGGREPEKGGCGCEVAGGGARGGLAFGLGLLFLALRRRRGQAGSSMIHR